MLIVNRPGWWLPERQATPEYLVRGSKVGRRGLIAGGALLAGNLPSLARAQDVKRNTVYEAGREITLERDATSYNNFYEFGTDKYIARAAKRLRVSPWSVEFAGVVEQKTLTLEDILKQVQQEERVYRHRCVEGWAMTVPWTGFPLKELVRIAAPRSSATYVQFDSMADSATMPGLHLAQFSWPYIEGVTMEEAVNDLAFVVTGMYGKPLPPQDGAPIRIVLPWKYGFKSAKSIVKVTFTNKRPTTFWEGIQPSEYGFWANVNPEVPHPRWSQATEHLLTSEERVPTRIYNGYGEYVAPLYAGMASQGDRLFR